MVCWVGTEVPVVMLGTLELLQAQLLPRTERLPPLTARAALVLSYSGPLAVGTPYCSSTLAAANDELEVVGVVCLAEDKPKLTSHLVAGWLICHGTALSASYSCAEISDNRHCSLMN